MITSFRVPACALVALIALYVPLPSANGHAFMTQPLSRLRALGQAEWVAAGGNGLGAQPFRSYPSGAAMNDQPDICGGPHQDVGNTGAQNRGDLAAQAVYNSGDVIPVKIQMNAYHYGWVGVNICPTAKTLSGGATQACFDQYPLIHDATGYTRFWLMDNSVVSENWRLPAGVTCEDGCMLQMHYRTANSCVDTCEEAECGVYSRSSCSLQCHLAVCNEVAGIRGERFRDCADIRIVGSGVGSDPSPSPSNDPSPSDPSPAIDPSPPISPSPSVDSGSPGGPSNACPATPTFNQACGPKAGGASCKLGSCCSKWGWCGITAAHCSDDICADSSGPSNDPSPSPSDPSPANDPSPAIDPSPANDPSPSNDPCPAAPRSDAACGPNNNGASCKPGFCCSKWGWCGSSSNHCSTNICT
eukprot:gene3066-13085_t